MTTPSSSTTSSGRDSRPEGPQYSPVTASSVHASVQQHGYPSEYVQIVFQALDEFQLALSSAHDGQLLRHDIPTRAKNSHQLYMDRYSEDGNEEDLISSSQDTRFDEIFFLSGNLVRTLLDEFLCIINPNTHMSILGTAPPPRGSEYGDGLSQGMTYDSTSMGSFTEERFIPGVESLERLYEIHEIVETAFYIYVTEPGFADTITTSFNPNVPVIAIRTAPHDDLVMAAPGPYSTPLAGETAR